MRRRAFIIRTSASLLGLAVSGVSSGKTDRRLSWGARRHVDELYNGIVPPDSFPPVLESPWSTDELPYYIISPPPVIRIDLGRQLFVDDFLIESMILITRTFHTPEPYEGNPVFSPSDEDVHERIDNQGFLVQTQDACPYSDGVWWDTEARMYRAWYQGGPNTLRLAESTDGLTWTRQGSGVVMAIPPQRNSGTVWIDPLDPDPGRRYKMSYFAYQDMRNWLYTSADGVNWPPYSAPMGRSAYYASNPDAPTGDRTTFFYNPFRAKWVWSLRDLRDERANGGLEYHRMRRYWEGDDLFEASAGLDQSGYWLEADSQDREEAGPPDRPQLTIPQIYNVDAFAYESVMIFGLSILSSNSSEDRVEGEAVPKRNEVYLGFSRDGFYQTRPSGTDRRPFHPVGLPDAWNEGNVQTVGGGCVIVGDPESELLRFFFSGRRDYLKEDGTLVRHSHLGCASLRRDGFASLHAGVREGVVTTRAVRFDHVDGYLFVNVDSSAGNLRVEVLDNEGHVIPGFERDSCEPIVVDSTKHAVSWTNARSLAALSGTPFRLRFLMRSGSLYSFWVAPTKDGASEGYLAAGGPAYKGYRDASPPDTSAIEVDPPSAPSEIRIAPNPVADQASITYLVAEAGQVVVSIHDVAGRTVRVLREGLGSPGVHIVQFDRRDLAAGVYFCRVRVGSAVESVKFVVVATGR